MATINRHKPCGATILKTAAFVQPPRYYDARGVTPLTACPTCGRTLREHDLSYVRVYIAPMTAPPRETKGST